MANKVYTVGRDSSNNIIIDDYSDVVSRHHATVRVSGRKRFITDHSTNGTYLNGCRLSTGVEYPYTKNDAVMLGGTVNLPWNCINSGVEGSKVAIITLASLLGAILVALAVLYTGGVITFPEKKVDVTSGFVSSTDSLATSSQAVQGQQEAIGTEAFAESEEVNEVKQSENNPKSGQKSKPKSGKSKSKSKPKKSDESKSAKTESGEKSKNDEEGFKDVSQVDGKQIPVL